MKIASELPRSLRRVISTAVSVTVQAETATMLKATPNFVPEGEPVTLTTTVGRTGYPGTPTGSVKFESEGLVLGTAVLRSVGGLATATFTASSAGVAPGTYAVTATYSGDKADAGSTSQFVTVIVIR